MNDRPLNPTAASLLGLLHHGPMTGWDLVSTAQTVIGEFWSLTQSQVYRELVTMTEAGLLEAGERGRRDRRPYLITEAGRAAFSAWIDRGPSSATIRIPLLLTVLFGRHLPSTRLAGILAHHHELRVDRLAHYDSLCTATTAESDPRWRCSTSGVAMNAPCWSGLPGCRRS